MSQATEGRVLLLYFFNLSTLKQLVRKEEPLGYEGAHGELEFDISVEEYEQEDLILECSVSEVDDQTSVKKTHKVKSK